MHITGYSMEKLGAQESFLIIQAHARPPAIEHCLEG